MDELPPGYLRQLQMRVGELGFRLTKLKIASFPAQREWCPPINAYQAESEFVICVDLAGVDRSAIELSVEPRRVVLRGHRHPPGPAGRPAIIALEIDHGPFEREIPLPDDVRPQIVRAEHRQGILWIHLPFTRCTGSEPTRTPPLP